MASPTPFNDPYEHESKMTKYSKRKASDPQKSPLLRKRLARHGNDPSNTLLGTYSDEDNSQKRQRMTHLECDLPNCWKKFDSELDLITHKQSHEMAQDLFPIGSKSGGSSYSESTMSTIHENIFDREYSESGLTNDSHSSNHSSPSPLDFENRPDILPESLHNSSHIQIMQSPGGYEILGGELLDTWSAPSICHLSAPRSMICPLSTNSIHMSRTTSFNQNSESEQVGLRHTQNQQEVLELDQETIAISAASNNSFNLIAPSFSGNENPSTEGGRSSESRPSSEASESEPREGRESSDNNSLRGIINQAVSGDTEVAEILFQALDGRLECAPPNPNDHFEDSGLSLFSLLELQDSTPIENSRAFTTYAPSSSSGSSSYSQNNFISGDGDSSSASNGNKGSGDNNGGRGSHNPSDDNNSSQLTQQQQNTPRSASSQPSTASPFRCIHNALAPETFRVTDETKKKYSTCAGPGWNSIQHLKEHINSHHTKKKSSVLQCTRCQEKFKNQKILKDHETNVDCPIKCPICRQEFERKAMRQAHQEQIHVNENRGSHINEIDEAMDEKIKQNLKSYGDSLKKGKAPIPHKMEKWIEENTERYMTGRPAKANAKLELGQWYTIFTTLSSREIPQHPFYDLETLLLPSELAAEKILLIHEETILARISAHGDPPTGGQQQRDWYQDVLRQSLQIAAKTKLILRDESKNSSTSDATPVSTYSQDMSAVKAPIAGFNSPTMASTRGRVTHQSMARSHSAQLPAMTNGFSGMILPPVFPESQHVSHTIPNYSSVASDTIPGPSNNIAGLSEWSFAHNEQAFAPSFFEPQQDFDSFEPTESNTLQPPHYPAWDMQNDRRR